MLGRDRLRVGPGHNPAEEQGVPVVDQERVELEARVRGDRFGFRDRLRDLGRLLGGRLPARPERFRNIRADYKLWLSDAAPNVSDERVAG